ncbi:MAG TPA: hypothetical protein VGU71_05385 [Candidatus Dormibacteraeota bacterium]|nr:hypothetical protein [Candidatus Dormibacteraeota bacterium]
MKLRDRRSFRVALVADRYLNPPAGGLDVIPILLEAGWGVIQLPADVYPSEVATPLLEQVAEQTEEFHRHRYDVVVIGRRDGLEEALIAAGLPRLDQVDPANAGALEAFLSTRPSPKAKHSPRRTARSTTVKEA